VRQSAGGRDVSFDLPEVALVDNSSSASEVLVDSSGGKTTIAFRFPYFESSLLYDPTMGFEAEGDANMESAAATTSTAAAGTTSGATSAAPTAEPGATVISGSLKMSVEDPAAFCGSADVIMALRKAIARASKRELGSVAVTCAVAARRLQEARRLAGTVDVGYTVTLPPGTPSETSDATLQALTSISTEELTTIVNEELTSSGAGVEAQVTAKGAITRADPEDGNGMASAARAPAGAGVALGFSSMALAMAHCRV